MLFGLIPGRLPWPRRNEGGSVMSEDKWKPIEEGIDKKKRQDEGKKEHLKPDLPTVDPGVGPQGILEKVKIGGVERKARIEALTLETKARLEVWAHRMKAEVIVAQTKLDVRMEEQLELIGKQHLENLRDLGIKNFEERSAAVQQLSRVAAAELLKIQDADVPNMMKEKMLNGVAKQYEDLFDRILSDEIGKPKA